MIVLHATFPIDPDAREKALEAVEAVVEASNQEPGMIDYRAAVDVEDPNLIRFTEQYEDEDAFEAHTQTDHFQAFEATFPEILAGEPDLRRFEVESYTDVEA